MATDLSHSRREVIAARLDAGEAVVAGTLASEFGVSEDAIRRDLRALAAEGRCRRVYGGALPIAPGGASMASRIDEGRTSKQALAREAAGVVTRAELIFIDSGSTNLSLVEALPEDADLTIVTNSPDIASAALRRTDLSVIMIGGVVNPVVGGCVDTIAAQAVALMRFDHAFIGACSVSAGDGIAAFDYADAGFKRIVMAQARQITVLAITQKLIERAPYHVAQLGKIDFLVIEENATAEQRAALDEGGCGLLLIAKPL